METFDVNRITKRLTNLYPIVEGNLVCEHCGSGEKLTLSKDDETILCINCKKEVEVISKEEFKNKKRTELIDKIIDEK